MISLCIPTYNRTGLLFASFTQVIDDPRVSEVVIVDDLSNEHVWNEMRDVLTHSKIKLFRNSNNIDCYRNKHEAVSKATNEWVILLDSDNIIDTKYIDRIESLMVAGLNNKTIYQPCFASPHFDFRRFNGILINKSNVAQHMRNNMFETMLNACNYFVNRDEYMSIFDPSTDPVTSDSIYMASRWLSAGNSIYVVPDLEYFHRIHEGSHFQNNVRRTPRGFHDRILSELKSMR